MSRPPLNPQDLLAGIEAAVQAQTAARHRLRDVHDDAARRGALLTPEEFLPLWNGWKRAQRKLDALRRAAKKAGVHVPAASRRPPMVCPVCGRPSHGLESTA